MTLIGEWNSETTYAVGDAARYPNGIFYQLVRPAAAGTPCADALYWNILPSPLQECAKMIMDIAAALKAEIESGIASDLAMIAPEYTKTTYSKGDIRTHEGKLYKAKANIGTAEDWTSSHWDEITVGGQIVALDSAIGTLDAAVATIPTNIDEDSISLKTASSEYVITVDDSGDTPELVLTEDTSES